LSSQQIITKNIWAYCLDGVHITNNRICPSDSKCFKVLHLRANGEEAAPSPQLPRLSFLTFSVAFTWIKDLQCHHLVADFVFSSRQIGLFSAITR
jgi:hypothetical protein